MQKIRRRSLDPTTAATLATLTSMVAASPDPKAEAARLWKGLDTTTRRSIQATLVAMCTGLERCMYCEDSAGTDIEHYWPKGPYPQHAFSWNNYLYACSRCNSNHKRNQFPLDSSGNPLLLNPAVDDPLLHLTLTPRTGRFTSSGPRGWETIAICGLNRDECARGRADAWYVLDDFFLPAYARFIAQGNVDKAQNLLGTIRRQPFQSVRQQMAHVFHHATNRALLLSADTIAAFSNYPELAV